APAFFAGLPKPRPPRRTLREHFQNWYSNRRVMAKKRILFLCTGNSCRSQMAEGWAKKLKTDTLEAYSAGTEPHGMNARAIKVMAEAGIDISGHHSKHV